MTEHFENLVLGSGQGGKLLAWHLARSGQRTAGELAATQIGGFKLIRCQDPEHLGTSSDWGYRLTQKLGHGPTERGPDEAANAIGAMMEEGMAEADIRSSVNEHFDIG